MNSNQIFINELTRERERILREIQGLQSELEVIQRLLAKRVSSESNLITDAYIKKPQRRPLQALKKIFSDNPKNDFIPGQLRDELQKLRDNKLLKSNANNLLFVTHSALKSLLKKNIIIKNDMADPPSYHLREDLQGKLI